MEKSFNETQELLTPLEVDPMTWYALYEKESGRCSFSEMVSLHDSYSPTALESSQCFDNSFPLQIIDTSEPIPLVTLLLARAHQAYKQSPSRL